jgi:hypothetical protein
MPQNVGHISVYEDPVFGSLLKFELDEDRGEAEDNTRIHLGKRGEMLKGENYLSIEMPFLFSQGVLPARHTKDRGRFLNIWSAFRWAKPQQWDEGVLLPLPNIEGGTNEFALNIKSEGNKNGDIAYSGVIAESNRLYMVKVIYTPDHTSHLFLDGEEILTANDRFWKLERRGQELPYTQLEFFHGGGYFRARHKDGLKKGSFVLNGPVKIDMA